MTRRAETIAPDYFDKLYIDDADPWGFRSSDYERGKYADTLAALETQHYYSALEVGCSIGVFTRLLAGRCDDVLAIDASAVALQSARHHCADLKQVRFDERMIPTGFPAGRYGVVVISEVLYYLTAADVARTAELCAASVAAGGEIVLCHWLGETDYPLSGDAAASAFIAALPGGRWRHTARRRPAYRLDHLRCEVT